MQCSARSKPPLCIKFRIEDGDWNKIAFTWCNTNIEHDIDLETRIRNSLENYLFKFILTIAFFRLPQFEKYTSGVVSKSFGDHLGAKIAQRQQEPTYVSNTWLWAGARAQTDASTSSQTYETNVDFDFLFLTLGRFLLLAHFQNKCPDDHLIDLVDLRKCDFE